MSGKPRRRRTENVLSKEVEFMVLQYSCLDSGVVQALGKSCLAWNWLVKVGGGSMVDLKLTVDTHILGRPEISLSMGGNTIFPPGAAGGKEKAKLKEDLKWQCPFRGQIAGIGQLHRFELRPEHGDGSTWYPATITKQREDGLFEVSAQMPDGGTTKVVHFPAVRQELLRDAGSKVAVKPEMRCLVLSVPCKDPKNVTLTVDSYGSHTYITHFFARRTPPVVKDSSGSLADAKSEPPRIKLSVSQNRSKVQCEVGHTVFEHFLNGEVRSISQELLNNKARWKVQVGPYAVHTVELERRYTMSQVFTLSVDGDVLCEATAEDLESPSGTWECTFRLLGEKFLDWEVYEQTSAGISLGTTGMVSERTAYAHECVVSVPTDGTIDLRNARFLFDGLQYSELPACREALEEVPLSLEPEALMGSYNLEVPTVHREISSFVSSFISNMGIGCSNDVGGLNGLFCCGAAHGIPVASDIMPIRMGGNAPGIMDPTLIYPVLDSYDADEDDSPAKQSAPTAAEEVVPPSRSPDDQQGAEAEAKDKEDVQPCDSTTPQASAGHTAEGSGQAVPPQATKPQQQKCCTVQ